MPVSMTGPGVHPAYDVGAFVHRARDIVAQVDYGENDRHADEAEKKGIFGRGRSAHVAPEALRQFVLPRVISPTPKLGNSRS